MYLLTFTFDCGRLALLGEVELGAAGKQPNKGLLWETGQVKGVSRTYRYPDGILRLGSPFQAP